MLLLPISKKGNAIIIRFKSDKKGNYADSRRFCFQSYTQSFLMKMPFRFAQICFFTLAISSFACGEKEEVLKPAFSASSTGSVVEGISTAVITCKIELQAAVNQSVSVDYKTLDNTAVAGEDYLPATGTVTFAKGETSKTIDLTIVGDDLREADEAFVVELVNPSSGKLKTGFAYMYILNDDTKLDIANDGYETPGSYPGFELEWGDEFEAAAVNTADWSFEIGDGCPGNCGWGNNELEWYTDKPDNQFLTNGYLVIEARLESMAGKNYTSTRMKTQGKRSFLYGRIDIRAKLPVGQGVWPALWMLGEDITTAGWPACGEIDIMEYLGHETNKVYGTGHWGPVWTDHRYKGGEITSTGQDFSQEFHVFSVIWKENEITWLMNDQPYFTLSTTDTGVDGWPFDKPQFFLFNVAVGGNWPGNPDGNTVFPQRMIVDYVRVFKEN